MEIPRCKIVSLALIGARFMPHILVIEDESDIRNLLKEMLELAGYGVAMASDGAEGIALYRQHSADLVITDIMMPHKDGIETIRELKRDFPNVKIIAITGYRGSFSRLPAAEVLGAQRTIVKPFTRSDLLNAVSSLLT